MKSEARNVAKTELQMKLTDQRRSALQKYQDMVIGQPGIWKLLKYEIIMIMCNGLTGALGFAMRKILYPCLFAEVGRGTVFGRNMTIRHAHKIRIGDRCIFDDMTVLDAKGDTNQGITIGNDVVIARNTVVSCKGGDIEIGDNSNISLNCMIHSESSVRIGARNLWAAFCYIIGGGRHSFDRTDMPIIQQGSVSDGVVMDDDIWLGADVKIMDGCHIGRGVILGTGSVVNKDIPAFSVAAGAPARVIRKRQGHETQDQPAAPSLEE